MWLCFGWLVPVLLSEKEFIRTLFTFSRVSLFCWFFWPTHILTQRSFNCWIFSSSVCKPSSLSDLDWSCNLTVVVLMSVLRERSTVRVPKDVLDKGARMWNNGIKIPRRGVIQWLVSKNACWFCTTSEKARAGLPTVAPLPLFFFSFWRLRFSRGTQFRKQVMTLSSSNNGDDGFGQRVWTKQMEEFTTLYFGQGRRWGVPGKGAPWICGTSGMCGRIELPGRKWMIWGRTLAGVDGQVVARPQWEALGR